MYYLKRDELLKDICKETCESCFLLNCCIERENIEEAKKCEYVKKAIAKEIWFLTEVLKVEII